MMTRDQKKCCNASQLILYLDLRDCASAYFTVYTNFKKRKVNGSNLTTFVYMFKLCIFSLYCVTWGPQNDTVKKILLLRNISVLVFMIWFDTE